MSDAVAALGAEQVPTLAQFDFPVALVVTARGRTILRAGQTTEVFPFASVTKPLVAWSALVAVERGLLRLEDPAAPSSPALAGATIRHLLAHASGLAFAGRAPDGSELRRAAPGERRIYSNRGIEVLGERLEEATATPLEAWVEQSVLVPLGMASVLIPGSPAYSGEGSAADLALFAQELAAPTLVSAALAREACTVVFPGLGGVLPGYGMQKPNDFGLGMELRGNKQPHWTGKGNSPQTCGHFGQSGSFLWVDPVASKQAVFLGAEPFGEVHRRLWPALNDEVLALDC
ncbi:Beta-lactamase [Actinomyces bovis]|uniref:Beta-lactamase n=1 Tax=Actinomyces bovis TaxID=1658 RepID=A0ABY1VPL4_9ACTO|nr:serine hydrolase domain-containing protein [Actinomyces bovis]SPT53571.1 Beta-lactamase [Actinomyces bovis]VEG55564.1 Beta-lactamase [Actinomyces israelii]